MADQIDTRISGIPCIIECVYFFKQPALGPDCDSDWDANGYTDIEFEVLDRRGRPAPWLKEKMTTDDVARIKALIEDYLEKTERDL